MSRSYTVTLCVKCTHGSCDQDAVFQSESANDTKGHKGNAEQKAKRAGWSLKADAEKCPTHNPRARKSATTGV